MTHERTRRTSSDSEKSSSSRSYSTESMKTDRIRSPSTMKMETNSPAYLFPTFSLPTENLLTKIKDTFIDLNPFFQCSLLPPHWRKNKSLHFVVRAKKPLEIKSRTRVIILAGNDHNPSAQMKNNVGYFQDGHATFNDLRFLTVSGRGKKFNLNIIIETLPPQQCTYRRAIKITVDGPRKKRHSKPKSDVSVMQQGDSPSDEPFDEETRMTVNSTKTEPNDTTGQGSSALFLLAAVAEQKWRDEQDEPNRFPIKSAPKDITHSLNCVSPSSTLIAHFSQSIKFSPNDDFSPNGLQNHLFKSNNFTFYQPPMEIQKSTTTA